MIYGETRLFMVTLESEYSRTSKTVQLSMSARSVLEGGRSGTALRPCRLLLCSKVL